MRQKQRYGFGKMFRVFAALCLLVPAFLFSAVAQAAQAEDFTMQGIALGADEAAMLAAFGEPLYDRETMLFGIPLVTYTFDKGFTVSVDRRARLVREMRTENKDYTARGGVRYGATSYYLQRVFGKAERQNLDGAACFVYARDGAPHERLICTVDHDDGSLRALCVTSLPLTQEEADAWQESDLDAVGAQQMQLDLSALPQAETVTPTWEGNK